MALCAALAAAAGTLSPAAAFSVHPSTHRRAFVGNGGASVAEPFRRLASGRRAVGVGVSNSKSPSPSSSTSSSALCMCICINCSRVADCAAYHFVETKHEQPHLNASPGFEPRDGSPTINATFRTVPSERAESEFARMVKEHETQEAGAVERAREGGIDVEDADDSPVPLFGEEKYDLSPVTTIEYDVVACEDFEEDMGCWVRNMPEEIRLANPDFVPT